jgi:hypothetical protein
MSTSVTSFQPKFDHPIPDDTVRPLYPSFKGTFQRDLGRGEEM